MSGVLTELAVRQNRYLWLLEIDGLENTYYSSPSAPTLPAYTQPWAHTAQPGITNVTAADQTLDVMGSIVEAGDVAVTITKTRTNNAIQLEAAGKSGATNVATLAVTLAQTGAFVVEVNEDIAGWDAAGVLWIGREAIRYTAKTGVAPFQFTIIDADRGWFGSEQRKHIASPVNGWAPRVYSECVTWHGRKARVLVSSLRFDGTQADGWVEYISGRIVTDPEVSNDGHSIAINITPHTTALSDTEVGGGLLSTGLQQGYHTFDGQTAHRFEYAAGFGEGVALDEPSDAAAAPALPVPLNWTDHAQAFATPGSGASPSRQGYIKLASDAAGRFNVTARNVPEFGGGTLTVAPATTFAVAVGEWVRNVDTWDLQRASVLTAPATAEVIPWPAGACAILSAALSPGTTDGAGGSFTDMHIDPTGSLSLTRNTGDAFPRVMLTPWERDNPARLHYGIAVSHPDDTRMMYTYELRRVATTRLARQLNTDGAANSFDGPIDGETGFASVPIRGIADAFYQRGEQFLHVTDDVFSAASVLSVTWTEWDGSEHRRVMVTQSVQAANVITVGAPGFVYTLAPALRFESDDISFGDWPGQQRCVIEQLVAWFDADPGSIILDLLLSGDGDGFASATYDRFPGGASLTTAEVDVDSFLRYPYPDGLARSMSLSLNDWDSTNISALIDPILKAIGAAIVLRLDPVAAAGDGGVRRRKLSLIPVGAEYGPESVRTIANGDWLVDKRHVRPSMSVDKRIVNAIRMAMNYNAAEDEHQLVVPVSDRDSIGEYGSHSIEELDLRGVTLNASSVSQQIQAVVPFSAHRFAGLGYPRRQIEGSVTYADTIELNAGSTVIASVDHIAGYDKLPISAQPMRIVSINQNGYEQTAKLKLTWHDATVSGWAPSLKVAAVTNASTYTVEANQFTEATDPVTGATLADIDYWNIGDGIRACPLGDYGNSTGGITVANIVGNVITLSAPAAPALVIGDTLRPDSYDTGTADQKAFTFLGDDAGALGVAPDPAKFYG